METAPARPEPAVARKPWPPSEDQRGLADPWCGCRHFRVVYTRPGWGGRIIRRRKRRRSAKRMKTWEKVGG